MNAAVATAKAVLTIPGTVPQQLHPPAVTLGAWITTVGAFIVTGLPVVTALAGLGNPLSTLFGAAVAGKIVAAAQVASAVVGARAAHVAATGRSIVPAVDAGNAPAP